MNRTTRVAIVHGSYGSPEENGSWLAAKLRKDGNYVVAPKFPTPEGQSFANWRDVFRSEIGPVQKNMVLAGHSWAWLHPQDASGVRYASDGCLSSIGIFGATWSKRF